MKKKNQYYSEFNPNITTYIFYETDSEYPVLKNHFEKQGFGFMIPGTSVIIIDGEKVKNNDLLKWVEAHEISHHMLNHSSEYDSNEEIDADLGAYVLLEKYSYSDSCELVKKFFTDRHGIEFPNNRISEITKKLGLYNK
jgi:hypothetical protein